MQLFYLKIAPAKICVKNMLGLLFLGQIIRSNFGRPRDSCSKSSQIIRSLSVFPQHYLHGIGQHPRQSERDLLRKLLPGHRHLANVSIQVSFWLITEKQLCRTEKHYCSLQNNLQSQCGGSCRWVDLASGWMDVWVTGSLPLVALWL